MGTRTKIKYTANGYNRCGASQNLNNHIEYKNYFTLTDRPTRRLRLIIFLPFFVLIRARKPNFLTRFTLLCRFG